MRFLEAFGRNVLLGDGANGTWLAERGFRHGPFDLANLEAPDWVVAAHTAYFDAGADFVETNTFTANRFRLEGWTEDVRAVNLSGARLARQAAGPDRLVAGAVGPIGKPLAPIGHISVEDAFAAFKEQVEALAEGGVDAIMLETFIDVDELRVAVDAVRAVCDLPIMASKAYIEDGEALTEGLPLRVGETLRDLGIVAMGANCIVGPQRMIDIVRQLAETTDLPIMAFPTPGLPQLVKGQITYDTAPDYFARASMRLIEEGARVVGGCCGTTPAHIAEMRRLIDQNEPKRRARATVSREAKEKKPLPSSEPTELAQKLGRKFIIAVELDLPRGLNVQKVMQAARLLKIRGADLIDISDGARARLRMNPVSISKLIQDEIGIEVMMHFACRDRNLLAVQADLLGAHALGVRNILAVTGDPANIGDYPSATSVFDVDSIGLVRILSRFNEGVDLAGYSVGVRCAFTVASAYNPGAWDEQGELERLKRKADAGTHVLYTQPLFERSQLDKTLEHAESVKLPVFVGILPLRNVRHCEFMHHEVPGITIPDWLRAKMAHAPDDETALETGIEEAQKLAVEVRRSAQGLYLMPPFGSPQIAARVMEAVG